LQVDDGKAQYPHGSEDDVEDTNQSGLVIHCGPGSCLEISF
jgi:hypothetical protein